MLRLATLTPKRQFIRRDSTQWDCCCCLLLIRAFTIRFLFGTAFAAAVFFHNHHAVTR